MICILAFPGCQPDGLHRLFSIPMQELTDRDYEAHSVLGDFISHLGELLGNSASFKERVGIVNQLLLRESLRSGGCDGISAAAHRIILAGGRVRIPFLLTGRDWGSASLSADLSSGWVCVPSSLRG